MAKKKSKQNQCTFYVEGMHCPSCELLIEKKLLKNDNIEYADASLSNNKVQVEYTGEKPDLKKLNKQVEDLGYQFVTHKVKKDEAPTISFKGGELRVNQQKFSYYFKILLVVASLLVAFYFFEKLQVGQFVSVDASSSLGAFFLLGLVAGLSSCAALVGGLLLSMTKQWNEVYIDSDSNFQKAEPHLMFHVGRVLSFFLLGGILGAIGSAISLDNTVFYSVLVVFISIVMLILALQMLGVGWAQKFRFTAPKFITRTVSDESKFQGKYMPFLTGALTFFLPCGFTLIAQGLALTSGSFIEGALIMFAFALGTLPILMGISFTGVQFNKKPHLTAKFNLVAGILIIFFVIYNINGQLNVLGMPSLSDINFSRGGNTEELETDNINEDGIQQLDLIADDFSYIPQNSTTLQSGIDTIIVVDNQGIKGCGAYLASTGLIDGYVELKPGENTIEIGEPEPGVYKITCTMGMVPPVTVEVI
jgi:sulfite exporter TauE/SafE/copper chaperone CopZ